MKGGFPHPVMDWGGGGYPIQSWMGGGTPSSLGQWGGGYHIQSWMGGTPSPRSGRGVRHSADGEYPIQPGMGNPPSLSRPGMGYPPPIQTWDGVPPLPPASVDRLKLLPSLILRMRAVKTIFLQRTGYCDVMCVWFTQYMRDVGWLIAVFHKSTLWWFAPFFWSLMKGFPNIFYIRHHFKSLRLTRVTPAFKTTFTER